MLYLSAFFIRYSDEVRCVVSRILDQSIIRIRDSCDVAPVIVRILAGVPVPVSGVGHPAKVVILECFYDSTRSLARRSRRHCAVRVKDARHLNGLQVRVPVISVFCHVEQGKPVFVLLAACSIPVLVINVVVMLFLIPFT